jgi:membrane protein required for colicin V production
MVEALKYFYEAISIIDLIYLIVTIIFVIKSYHKGFILSLLSASKWLLAYVVTLILFPRIKPYFKNMLDNVYVLDISLGITIFVLVTFLILVANKGISKTVKFIGLGRVDSVFGFFFGFIKSYIVCVLIFSAIDTVFNYNKWPISTDKSYAFPYIEKGSIYLMKVLPNEKKYQNSKEKIEKL